MRIMYKDILSSDVLDNADAICFTSNGVVKTDGSLVMGAGNALAFKNKFPGIDKRAGQQVREFGNHVNSIFVVGPNLTWVLSFPTKNHWRDQSDIELIKRSAHELMEHSSGLGWKNIYLPAPGIGHGGLSWAVVKNAIESIFDDTIIITFLNRS
jgi:Macro domain